MKIKLARTPRPEAREPVREGTFSSTDRHERDRRAKYGKHDDASVEAAPSGVKQKKAKAP